MTGPFAGGTVEERIDDWRRYLGRRREIRTADVDELEDHLRDEIAALREVGLADDEAFLVAVRRLGDVDTLSREFAREHTERLWKQILVSPRAEPASPARRREAWVAIALAVGAALAVKAPELFGLRLEGPSAATGFYARNFSLFVLPFLAAFFAWKRGLDRGGVLRLALPFVAGAVVVNVLPFGPASHTERLVALHLPIALWFAVGFAYAGGRWRDHDRRMDFVRFSGEWFIYYALIALGGGVLVGFTAFVFHSIGLDVESLLERWVLPCGVVGAAVVAAWLAEAKQGVIENMAPVLTLVFTPLFAVALLAFLATMLWTGNGIGVEREVLIGFDLLLALVLGLLLYAISARDPQAPPGGFDALQLLLVTSALVVDALALWAISARISEFGVSPNKVAALGENLILLGSLGGSAWLYARLLVGRGRFATLERWQTAYLPVIPIWAWGVVVLFPVLFGYR